MDHIVESNHNATKHILGIVKNKNKSDNPEIVKLSEEQKQLNVEINSNVSPTRRMELRKLSEKLTLLHAKLNEEKTTEIREEVEEIKKKQK